MAELNATREQDADHRFAMGAIENFINDAMTAVGLPPQPH